MLCFNKILLTLGSNPFDKLRINTEHSRRVKIERERERVNGLTVL